MSTGDGRDGRDLRSTLELLLAWSVLVAVIWGGYSLLWLVLGLLL